MSENLEADHMFTGNLVHNKITLSVCAERNLYSVNGVETFGYLGIKIYNSLYINYRWFEDLNVQNKLGKFWVTKKKFFMTIGKSVFFSPTFIEIELTNNIKFKVYT